MGKEHKQIINEIQWTSKDPKTRSTSPVIKDLQIETTVEYYFLPSY